MPISAKQNGKNMLQRECKRDFPGPSGWDNANSFLSPKKHKTFSTMQYSLLLSLTLIIVIPIMITLYVIMPAKPVLLITVNKDLLIQARLRDECAPFNYY